MNHLNNKLDATHDKTADVSCMFSLKQLSSA